MQRKFIITADDYGISPLIDDAIEEAIEQGVVNSVAALPNSMELKNGEYVLSDYGIKRLQALQAKHGDKVSIGLHFNITNGLPLSGNSSLVIQHGEEAGFFKDFQRQALSDIPAIERELEAQIALFEENGIHISHFSDHYGILSTIRSLTLRCMIKVVKAYEKRQDRAVPVRNPLFTSKAFDTDAYDGMKTCLSRSRMERHAVIGFRRRNQLTQGIGFEQEEELSWKNILLHLQKMKHWGVLSPDYFVDKFYNAWDSEEAMECIVRAVPFGRYWEVGGPFMEQEAVIAEILTHPSGSHRAYKRKVGRDLYRQEIDMIKAYGSRMGYLKRGRVEEFEFLISQECKVLLDQAHDTVLTPYARHYPLIPNNNIDDLPPDLIA